MSKQRDDFIRKNVEKLITSLTGYQVYLIYFIHLIDQWLKTSCFRKKITILQYVNNLRSLL